MYRLYTIHTITRNANKTKQKYPINNALFFSGDILNNENTRLDRQLGHWSIKTLSKK